MPDPEAATEGEADGNDIIIKGGSVQVDFDDTDYHPVTAGQPHRKKHGTKKITRIVVVDDLGVEKFNSGLDHSGLKWTVTVTTE